MPVITTRSNTKILTTKLGLTSGGPYLEAYHLAWLLNYSQQHSVRKQVMKGWGRDFEEGVDFRLVHEEDLLRAYEAEHRELIGPIRAIKAARGRMFLTPSGFKKVLRHTSKKSDWLERTVAPHFPAPEARARAEDVEETGGAVSDDVLERQRQYVILETLFDHLMHTSDSGLRKLAVLNAELGVGRKLPDIRELVLKEPRAAALVRELPQPEPAADYIASHPVSQGRGLASFGDLPGIYYGLKQIGEKAGGYSAVQAGKAADVVAAKRGHTHDDIRKKKLPFNELPDLPDNTSGKLRKMYRFNAEFSNAVIGLLRMSPVFKPLTPQDLGPFSEGGENLPNLSRGPLD